MALKIEFTLRALADLKELRSYLLQNSGSNAADRVRLHIRARLRQLANFPSLGIKTSHPDIRALSLTRFPYRIYYVVGTGSIEILHIRHRARRPIDPAKFLKKTAGP